MYKQNRQDETKNNCRGKRILDSILDCITFNLFWKKKEVKILGIHCYSKPQTPLELKVRLQRMSVHTVSLAWQRPVETQSKSSFSQDISEVLMCGTSDSSGLRQVYNRGLPRQYDLRGARKATCSRQSRHPLLLLLQPLQKQSVSILVFGETQ